MSGVSNKHTDVQRFRWCGSKNKLALAQNFGHVVRSARPSRVTSFCARHSRCTMVSALEVAQIREYSDYF